MGEKSKSENKMDSNRTNSNKTENRINNKSITIKGNCITKCVNKDMLYGVGYEFSDFIGFEMTVLCMMMKN